MTSKYYKYYSPVIFESEIQAQRTVFEPKHHKRIDKQSSQHKA